MSKKRKNQKADNYLAARFLGGSMMAVVLIVFGFVLGNMFGQKDNAPSRTSANNPQIAKAQPAAAGLQVALRPPGHGQPHDEADLGRDDALHQAHRLAIDVLGLHGRDLCGRLGQRDIGKAVERAGQPGHDRGQILDRLGIQRQGQGPGQGGQQEGQAAAKATGLQYHRVGIRERQDPAVYRVVATRQQNAPSA